MNKLNICFTSNSSPWTKFHGGGQIFIHNLARNLSKLGHRVFVLYTGPGDHQCESESDAEYKTEWAYYIGYPWTGKFRQLNSATVYYKLKYLHNRHNFDIINSIGGEALFLPKYCKSNGIPFCVSIEHPDLKKIQPCLSFKKLWNSLFGLVRSRELRICKYISRNANLVFTPSKFTKEQAIRYFKIPPPKIQVVNHGIIAEMLPGSEKHKIRDKNGPIVFFGRLEPQKGVETLIKAYFDLLREGILVNQDLIIIGDGPYKKKYQKIVSDLCLTGRVHFKGWKSAAYLKKKLAEAGFCILPSSTESFGLSMAETLSQNVPLITTSAGSIPEVVDYGKGAWLAQPDNNDSLSYNIRAAINNYPESLRKANYGKEYVLETFSWHKAAQEYEKAYFHILNAI